MPRYHSCPWFHFSPAPPPACSPGTGLAWGSLLYLLTSPSCSPSPSSVLSPQSSGFSQFPLLLPTCPSSWLGPSASAPDFGCSGSPCPSADTGWPPSPPALLPVLTPPPPGRSRCPRMRQPGCLHPTSTPALLVRKQRGEDRRHPRGSPALHLPHVSVRPSPGQARGSSHAPGHGHHIPFGEVCGQYRHEGPVKPWTRLVVPGPNSPKAVSWLPP